MSRKSFPKRVVGLARVSSKVQADELQSLAGQFKALNEEARNFGAVPMVHDEVGSGGRPWHEREILRQVIREAALEGATIMVTSVDRLARELTVYDELVRLRLPVWVVGRGKITRRQLLEELKAAKADLDGIRKIATQDHASKKLSGKKAGGSFTYETSIRGGYAGHFRAGDRDRRMFELLAAHPDWADMSHRALSDHLNAINVPNVVTISGRQNPWTRDSVKKLRDRYRQHLAFEAEMDIADGIAPLDLHGIYSRVEAAKSKRSSETPEGEGAK